MRIAGLSQQDSATRQASSPSTGRYQEPRQSPTQHTQSVLPRYRVTRYRASSAPLRDLRDAPTALAACCGFDSRLYFVFVLYCIVLYCIVLYCIVLYCIVL
jgi:hypothetical protein